MTDQQNKRKFHVLSLIGFILSFIPIVILFIWINYEEIKYSFPAYFIFVPFILVIAFIVLNSIASRQSKKRSKRGRGFAITGIVISSVIAIPVLFLSYMLYSDYKPTDYQPIALPTSIPATDKQTQTALLENDTRWQVLLPETLSECKENNMSAGTAFLEDDMALLLGHEKSSIKPSTTLSVLGRFITRTGISGSYSLPMKISSVMPISCTYLQTGEDENIFIFGYYVTIEDTDVNWITHFAIKESLAGLLLNSEDQKAELTFSINSDDPDLSPSLVHILDMNSEIAVDDEQVKIYDYYSLFQPSGGKMFDPVKLKNLTTAFESAIIPLTGGHLFP